MRYSSLIGADEVSNPADFDADGIVNMTDFGIFAAAWLSHDPNEPGITTNPNYIGEPNYVDPNAFLNWNPICNLEVSGSSEYAIDLGDFASFCENWLWQACWRENYVAMYGMSGGGESMTMAAPPLMSTLAAYEPQPSSSATFEPQPVEEEPPPVEEEPPPVEEKSISERILDLEESIELLDKIWLEDPYIQQKIDSDDWNRFMDAVYDGLDELKMESGPIE